MDVDADGVNVDPGERLAQAVEDVALDGALRNQADGDGLGRRGRNGKARGFLAVLGAVALARDEQPDAGCRRIDRERECAGGIGDDARGIRRGAAAVGRSVAETIRRERRFSNYQRGGDGLIRDGIENGSRDGPGRGLRDLGGHKSETSYATEHGCCEARGHLFLL